MPNGHNFTHFDVTKLSFYLEAPSMRLGYFLFVNVLILPVDVFLAGL